MLRTLSFAAGLLGIGLATWSVDAADSFQPKSVSVDLPDSDQMFPGGSESDAINNNCLACHSADMVLNQPALPREAWTAEVNKMIGTYKAPIAPEDVDPIIDYLSKLQPGQ
jgi:hypothetical protein